MKHLNIKATEIFCRLLDSMGHGNMFATFEMDDSSKLILELIADKVETAKGTGKLYRLYTIEGTEQPEDAIIKFIVLDGRIAVDNFSQVLVYPAGYFKRTINVDEVSILIENGQIATVKTGKQSTHCKSANQWMKTISGQLFFKLGFPQPGPVKTKQNNFYIRPLLDMTEIEKANLLFTLHPEISRGFIAHVLTIATGVANNGEEFFKWENETLTDSTKTMIATEIKQRIEDGFTEMANSPSVLALRLFEGHYYPLLLHCLQQFTVEAGNERFNRGIEYVFDI